MIEAHRNIGHQGFVLRARDEQELNGIGTINDADVAARAVEESLHATVEYLTANIRAHLIIFLKRNRERIEEKNLKGRRLDVEGTVDSCVASIRPQLTAIGLAIVREGNGGGINVDMDGYAIAILGQISTHLGLEDDRPEGA